MKILKICMLSIPVALLFSACGSVDDREMKTAVSALKDGLTYPDAAKIKDVRIVNRENRDEDHTFVIVCGKVNSKNLSNAYVGYQEFHVNMLISKDKPTKILATGIDGSPSYKKYWCEGGANSN